MKINRDDILGLQVTPEELVCTDCADADELKDAGGEDFLLRTRVEHDDDFEYHCDRCGEQIRA